MKYYLLWGRYRRSMSAERRKTNMEKLEMLVLIVTMRGYLSEALFISFAHSLSRKPFSSLHLYLAYFPPPATL